MAFEAEPADTVGRGPPGQARGTRAFDDHFGVRRLLCSLGAVAPVGDEHGRFVPGTDQQCGIRAREPGQITYVDQVGYQHRVEVDGGQPTPQPLPALGNSHGL